MYINPLKNHRNLNLIKIGVEEHREHGEARTKSLS